MSSTTLYNIFRALFAWLHFKCIYATRCHMHMSLKYAQWKPFLCCHFFSLSPGLKMYQSYAACRDFAEVFIHWNSFTANVQFKFILSEKQRNEKSVLIHKHKIFYHVPSYRFVDAYELGNVSIKVTLNLNWTFSNRAKKKSTTTTLKLN